MQFCLLLQRPKPDVLPQQILYVHRFSSVSTPCSSQSLRYISFQLGYAQAHSYLSKPSELQQNLAVGGHRRAPSAGEGSLRLKGILKTAKWAQQLLGITKLNLSTEIQPQLRCDAAQV